MKGGRDGGMEEREVRMEGREVGMEGREVCKVWRKRRREKVIFGSERRIETKEGKTTMIISKMVDGKGG